MNVGVIGLGMTGMAYCIGLTYVQSNKVVGVDARESRESLTRARLLKSEVLFVCLPTYPLGTYTPETQLNTTILNGEIHTLAAEKFEGIVAVVSTVPNGFLSEKVLEFCRLKFACVPNFIRDEIGVDDFSENRPNIIVGSDLISAIKPVAHAFGGYPQTLTAVSLEAAAGYGRNPNWNAFAR